MKEKTSIPEEYFFILLIVLVILLAVFVGLLLHLGWMSGQWEACAALAEQASAIDFEMIDGTCYLAGEDGTLTHWKGVIE